MAAEIRKAASRRQSENGIQQKHITKSISERTEKSMAPLTFEERKFAEENHNLIYSAMQQQSIPSEHYDVAAEAYLYAVKIWFSRPDLRSKYKFGTIFAKWLKSYWFRHNRHESYAPIACRIDEPLPSGEGTFGDYIPDNSPDPGSCVSDLAEHLYSKLAPQEVIVLDYLVLGYQCKEIARLLGIRREYISKTRTKIKRKTVAILQGA